MRWWQPLRATDWTDITPRTVAADLVLDAAASHDMSTGPTIEDLYGILSIATVTVEQFVWKFGVLGDVGLETYRAKCRVRI